MGSIRVGLAFARRALTRATVDERGEIRFDGPQPSALPSTSGETLSAALGAAVPDSALPPLPLRCLTTSHEALAQVFGECSFTAGGERVEVWLDESGALRGRSTPSDDADDEGALRWKDREIPVRFAVAFAVAMCDPDKVTNRSAHRPGAGQALLRRLREPLLNVAAAAALLFAGMGVWFHREKGREAAELEAARRATMDAWSRLLPDEIPKDTGLPKALLRRIGEGGESAGPSALAFWTEIGRHMPDPQPLGLNVESLDLSPEGGRLSARVPAEKDDPLKNAAALEGHLNQSEKLRTRGDYEVRDGQVLVRLRMEFKP